MTDISIDDMINARQQAQPGFRKAMPPEQQTPRDAGPAKNANKQPGTELTNNNDPRSKASWSTALEANYQDRARADVERENPGWKASLDRISQNKQMTAANQMTAPMSPQAPEQNVDGRNTLQKIRDGLAGAAARFKAPAKAQRPTGQAAMDKFQQRHMFKSDEEGKKETPSEEEITKDEVDKAALPASPYENRKDIGKKRAQAYVDEPMDEANTPTPDSEYEGALKYFTDRDPKTAIEAYRELQGAIDNDRFHEETVVDGPTGEEIAIGRTLPNSPMNRVGANKPRSVSYEDPMTVEEDGYYGVEDTEAPWAAGIADKSRHVKEFFDPDWRADVDGSIKRSDVNARMTAWRQATDHPERANEFLKARPVTDFANVQDVVGANFLREENPDKLVDGAQRNHLNPKKAPTVRHVPEEDKEIVKEIVDSQEYPEYAIAAYKNMKDAEERDAYLNELRAERLDLHSEPAKPANRIGAEKPRERTELFDNVDAEELLGHGLTPEEVYEINDGTELSITNGPTTRAKNAKGALNKQYSSIDDLIAGNQQRRIDSE